MTNLLVFREQLKKFYSKYELYITPLCKFLLALVSLLVINSRIGYMSTLKNAAVVLILALLCSFLPINLTIVLAAAVTLAHLYAFSVVQLLRWQFFCYCSSCISGFHQRIHWQYC